MDAKEARAKYEANLKGDALKPYTEDIDARILEVISGENPRCSLHNPQVMKSPSLSYPSHEIQKALKKHYEAKGYEWTEHPDPDPGHPCGGAYTTLSW